MIDLFTFLLERAPPDEIDSLDACYSTLESLDCDLDASIDRAAAGGFSMDRLGYAFVAGYRAALRAIDPSLSRASLCATEEGGAHPRAIRTTLASRDGAFALDGTKTFATLASFADVLLVVASRGEGKDGRKSLQIARIPRTREGVTVADRAPLAFAPEVPHARVTFANVRVAPDEILEGDGYERVLKPFRTIEDLHVAASSVGYVVRLARGEGGEGRRVVERALAALAALRELSRAPLGAPVHVALAGALGEAVAIARDVRLDRAPEIVRARWQRDCPLLTVAQTVREMRLEAAWRAVSAARSVKVPYT